MDIKAIEKIKKELDKLKCKEYTLNIKFENNADITLVKTELKKERKIGFNK